MRRTMMLIALAVGLLATSVAVGQTYENVDLDLPDPAYFGPGPLVLVQRIEVSGTATVTSVLVKNTATPPRVTGPQVIRIEVRRPDGRVMGSASTSTALANLATTGVTVTTGSHNTFTNGQRFEVWVQLKETPTVTLGRKLALGETTVTSTPAGTPGVDYTDDATEFTVGPSPTVAFDGMVEDAQVYRAQRILAGRIVVDARDIPFKLTISQLKLINDHPGPGIRLTGAYIDQIEVRRASDDAELAKLSADTELAKLTTTGVEVTTARNNEIVAHGQVQLEIWVTLKPDAPVGHVLRIAAEVRCGNADFAADGTAPQFTVGQPDGFEQVTNLGLAGGHVFSGQRFLAQRIRVVDDDPDPYDVTITSLVIRNTADPARRLAETQIAKIEVVRARDGAPMGSVTGVSGLNTSGVRVSTGSNNVVRDDTAEILEVWVTLKENIPHDRDIKLESVVWHTEDGWVFDGVPDGPDSATFTTGPMEPEGFEEADVDDALKNRTVFQGMRFLAQRIKLVDDDPDPYDVIITSLMIRNMETASPLADQHVARIEVRRKADNALLGEVEGPVGLSLAGVRVESSSNNVVPDDTSVELEIWVTLRQTTPSGRKLKLETIVWHREGEQTFQTDDPPLVGPAVFTTGRADPPTNVDFTWAPTEPRAEQKITFTPDAAIDDPEGDITKAEFRWVFGDGEEVTTTGPKTVEHTYTQAGTYEVTLTVTSEIGVSTTRMHGIEVAPAGLRVSLTWSPEDPLVGQEITLTAEVEDSPVEPVIYAWDFGDGNDDETNEPTATHTYEQAGTFTVNLVVTDGEGITGQATGSITLTQARRPTLGQISVSPSVPEVEQQVTFSVPTDSPDDPASKWEWDFGDGTARRTTNTNTVTHTYTEEGVYQAQVRALNLGGWSGWRQRHVYVRRPGAEPIGTWLTQNPVVTQAVIQIFAPAGATEVRIRIFDMLGRMVHEANVTGGEARWNLTDERGRAVPSSVYFYVVTAILDGSAVRSGTGRILVVR